MKHTLTLFLLLCLFSGFSQTIDPNDYVRNTYTTTFNKLSNAKEFHLEVSPWVVRGDWFQYYFTTHFTAVWATPNSVMTPVSQTVDVGKSTDYGPNWNLASSHWWSAFQSPSYLESPGYIYREQWRNYHWRRNYNGIFSAHVMNNATAGQIIFAVSHGENKNEKIGNYLYQNTVRPSFLISGTNPGTYSGYNNGVYTDCWEAYFAFLNGNWLPYNAANDWGANYLNDLGPIAWPSAGYVNASDSQASTGLRHPSSIVHNSYLYIFVKDESPDGTGGVKLVRVHVNNALDPQNYETWSAQLGWIPSLPAGFNKNQAANFFKSRGPNNTPVFPNDMNTIRFSVARFRNTNQFIGVELYNDGTIPKVAFRFSTDLINWSGRTVIYTGTDWNSLPLKYPIFYSSNGESNTEIDYHEFYVAGSDKDNKITKIHFKLPASAAPFSTPAINDTSLLQRKAMMVTNKPNSDELVKLYPNPASYSTEMTLPVAVSGHYQIDMYTSNGVLVRNILNSTIAQGSYRYKINMEHAGAGVYFIRIKKDGRFLYSLPFIKR